MNAQALRPADSAYASLQQILMELHHPSFPQQLLSLYVMEEPHANLALRHHGQQTGILMITRGLLDLLSVNELKAVMAHQLMRYHIGDARWVSWWSEVLSWALRIEKTTADPQSGYGRKKISWRPFVSLTVGIGMVFLMVKEAPVFMELLLWGAQYLSTLIFLLVWLATLLPFFIRVGMERYLPWRMACMDNWTALWTQDPNSLASALNKIDQHNKSQLLTLNRVVQDRGGSSIYLFLVEPAVEITFYDKKYWKTCPVSTRIQRLGDFNRH
jgi:Zn-dependent protease with chaperone function